MSTEGQEFDAVIVGSGPNGLAAAVTLTLAGHRVLVLEAAEELGGGTRTAELTLPGYHHDVCSAVHTTGIVSPLFTRLPLHEHGLEWIEPPASAAHPLDGGRAVLLERSLEATAERLGNDAGTYRRLLKPLLAHPDDLVHDLLGPLRIPRRPFALARFGLKALWPASGLAKTWFSEDTTRALVAGCAAHSTLPLSTPSTAAMALIFLTVAHVANWPVARGGSQAISRALASLLVERGGQIECGRRVESLDQVPPSRAVLFDLAPRQLLEIAGDALPESYRRRVARYRYGPGVFKLDFAMDGEIPWTAPEVSKASTVHVGGTLDEIAAAERAVWQNEHPERPFVMVCQQSHFDDSRAPAGHHTGYAYCHVPSGSSADVTEPLLRQLERFAPGVRDRILATHTTTAAAFEAYNPAYVGGAITGGAADLTQLFTRPIVRLDPYSTPNPRLTLCSHATPPGGGVHGMCGYYAARSVLRRWHGGGEAKRRLGDLA